MKFSLFLALCICFLSSTNFNIYRGEVLDSYNGVPVYYNGENYTNVSGRNISSDGYNLGLKYQCVEFVKRYYYEYYNHKMPNSYGHAKDFFDKSLNDKEFNQERGLLQFRNVRTHRPLAGDIIIYDSDSGNPFGHVGIITEVGDDFVELIQQNIGTKTRQKLKLVKYAGIYTIADYDILGWLRAPFIAE